MSAFLGHKYNIIPTWENKIGKSWEYSALRFTYKLQVLCDWLSLALGCAHLTYNRLFQLKGCDMDLKYSTGKKWPSEYSHGCDEKCKKTLP